MYNDKLVYKVAIWVFFWGIRLWREKEALIMCSFLSGSQDSLCYSHIHSSGLFGHMVYMVSKLLYNHAYNVQ